MPIIKADVHAPIFCFPKLTSAGSIPVLTTKFRIMKYVFRGYTVFEYDPNDKYEKVKQGKIHDTIPAFDFCRMIPEDYRLLGEFFTTVYRHTQGENVELKDIEVD